MSAAGGAGDAVREEMVAAGWRKRAGDVYTRDLDDGVLGWVGMNAAANRPTGPLEIGPVVGVRHQELESRLARLREQKPHAYLPPTLSCGLGYVMPDGAYRSWDFPGDDEGRARRSAVELVAAVGEHGVPFLERHRDLGATIESLRSGAYGVPEQNAFRVPVGLAMLGRPDEAAQAVREHLDSLGGRTDLAADAYRAYARNFTEDVVVRSEQRRPDGRS